MRKLVVVVLVGTLLCATIPGAAMAGDRHSGSNVAAGVVLGATAAVVGGVLLNALSGPPVAYAQPPVVYTPAPPVVYSTPPPVVYTPAPPVVYSAPPVIYHSAPVVAHRGWGLRDRWDHRWDRGRYERGRGRDRY
jgi:hypothetical protein